MSQIHWTNPISGAFETAADWSGGVVPGPNDDAILDAAGKAFTVTANAGETVASIQTAAGATLDITGGTFTVTAGSGAGVNAGSISVAGGAAMTVQGTLANGSVASSASYGRLTVSGSLLNEGSVVGASASPSGSQVAGVGIDLQAGFINNSGGTVLGGAGYAGAAAIKGSGGTLVNSGLIEGGAGRYGRRYNPGGDGGAGLSFLAGVLTVSNRGTIEGGAAGAGGFGAGSGGGGGKGVVAVAATITNDGLIQGAAGGPGGNAGQLGMSGGSGGAGGTGVYLFGVGMVSNSGQIVAGRGGSGGAGYPAGPAGYQGIGIDLRAGGRVTNGTPGALIEGNIGIRTLGGPATVINSGTIEGNGRPQLYTRNEGIGIDVYFGGHVTNESRDALIEGFIGIRAVRGPVTIVNFGTIEGTGGTAVDLSHANQTLYGESGSRFVGAVSGGGGTLHLLGAADAPPGTMDGISGFSTITVASGAAWNLGGATTLTRGDSLTSSGDVTVLGTLSIGDGATASMQGTLANQGEIAIASTGGFADLRVLAGGLTLTGSRSLSMSGPKARIFGVSSGATLTNVANTILGAGFIGLSQMTLDNERAGVIDATGVLVVGTAGETLTNEGLLEATGKGELVIASTTVNQLGGGTIQAGSGAIVELQNADIIGGSVGSLGKGSVFCNIQGSVLDGRVTAVSTSGVVRILDAANLTLQGSIIDTGQLALMASASATDLIIGVGGATLTGRGQVNLERHSALDRVRGVTTGTTLTNVDNRISGGGALGAGSLRLVNDAAGVIIGDQAPGLTIDTGASTIVNAGTIAAGALGGTIVRSAVDNTGVLFAAGGTLILEGAVTGGGSGRINGGTLDAAGAFGEKVTFTGTTGVLELAHSQAYGGAVSGLSTTGKSSLDLRDITFISGKTRASFADNGHKTGGVLTVTDGTHTARITLAGDYAGATFTASSDGHGGTTVVDPRRNPAPGRASVVQLVAAMASLGGGGSAGLAWADARPSTAPMFVRPSLHSG